MLLSKKIALKYDLNDSIISEEGSRIVNKEYSRLQGANQYEIILIDFFFFLFGGGGGLDLFGE